MVLSTLGSDPNTQPNITLRCAVRALLPIPLAVLGLVLLLVVLPLYNF
jgi:hypothetical protein